MMKNIEFKMSALPLVEEESLNVYKQLEERQEQLAFRSAMIANYENAMHSDSRLVIC